MKKSRITKLALSGAAVAALAATFSTSTYAWYVSNKVANVNGGTGQTGSAGADGSVLLSWNGTAQNAKWAKDLDFTDTANGAPDISGVKLTPVHYDATGTAGFYNLDASGAKAASALTANSTSDSGSYLSFTIYAKTESATPITVRPSFTINNTTTSLTGLEQLAYVGTADGSPVATGTNFVYNCLDALYVQQNTTASSGSGNSATEGAVTALTYVAASKTGVRGTTTIGSGWTAAGAGNAHTYYNTVSGNTLSFGLTPACADADDAQNNVTAGTLSDIVLTTTPLAITYNIFLDGGDLDCFNSCAGQTISFSLKLSVQQ